MKVAYHWDRAVQTFKLSGKCGKERKASLAAEVSRPGYSSLSNHKYIPRRAVLYVPGNDEKKIKKIPSLNVDCAVLDCEDGVAVNKKVSKVGLFTDIGPMSCFISQHCIPSEMEFEPNSNPPCCYKTLDEDIVI
ncbi:Citrate lyase subunit beta-like protein, mitochondrial [Pteropus alecto]|uniref:Citrate lyase subunit beta-like protein, mitochondrial n=1 Tax=Pteropus alecto TaxID=9402 RepID=L5KUS2_PTEAL|nr:Citrate lyase subunit beta-like protein, mitochondrial [Pteropus alecto]